MSRITLVFNNIEIAFGYDSPPDTQNPAIKNLLNNFVLKANVKPPEPGYFFSVYLRPLQWHQDNTEEQNDALDIIDGTGEGTVVSLGFYSGLTPEQFLKATYAYHIPDKFRKMVMDGLDPGTGKKVAQPYEITVTKQSPEVPTPKMLFVASALYLHFSAYPEPGVNEQIIAFLHAERAHLSEQLLAKFEAPRYPALYGALKSSGDRSNWAEIIKTFFTLEFGGHLDYQISECLKRGVEWYASFMAELEVKEEEVRRLGGDPKAMFRQIRREEEAGG